MADQRNPNEYRQMYPPNFPPQNAGPPTMMAPQIGGKATPGFAPQPPPPHAQGGGMPPAPPMMMNAQGPPPPGSSGDTFNRTAAPPQPGGPPPPGPAGGAQRPMFQPPPMAGAGARPPGPGMPPTSMMGAPPRGGPLPPMSSASMSPLPPGMAPPPAASGVGPAAQHAPGMVNGVNSSPQQPQPPSGLPAPPPLSQSSSGPRPPGPAPPQFVANGPFSGGFPPPGPPMSQAQQQQGAPLPGQRLAGPVGLPPPNSVSSQQRPPAGGEGPPPSAARPATLATDGTPPSSSPALTPGGLPVPFHGQAQYSHQLGVAAHLNSSLSVTPTNSEPASQRSSRAPSPVPGNRYDALEGQFSTPTSPQPPVSGTHPPFPGQSVASPAGSMPPAPPGTMSGPQSSVAPPSFPLTLGPGPGGTPPQPQMHRPPGMFAQQPGMPPRPPGAMQQGLPPPPQPGMPPHSQPGVPPPPPTGMPTQPGMQPQPGMPPTSSPPSAAGAGITGRRQYPQMPSQPGYNQPAPPPPPPGQAGTAQPGFPQPPGPQPVMGNSTAPHAPQPQGPMAHNHVTPNNAQQNAANLSGSFGRMSLQQQMEGRAVNLLQERNLIPPNGFPDVKPNLAHDFKKVNVNPEIFRCTLSTIPNTQSLLNKSRLPLGILIHPFKDLSQLPVITSSVIVRCRSCRTYINPFVNFVDMRRWKCNLCYRVNDLPDEFNYDPVSKTYGEPQRRPEVRSSTIEFIAPQEYMLRPPQPAVYFYVLDVSFNAVSTGYLQTFCQTLLDELDRIPGDARTQIGFITVDSSVHFYNLAEGLSQPQMLVVSDVDDIFVPCHDNLLVNLAESREMVTDLLTTLPSMFENTVDTGSSLGAALQVAFKIVGPSGGRISVFQTVLPSVGPGALKNREDPNERAGKNVQHCGPVTDFYKKLSLECSSQQVAVDLFMLNSQYADMATVSGISKFSGGSLNYFPGLHPNNPAEVERFEGALRRYFTRKIGFEAVMRIRCTRGLSIHTFHGNFFVRSTDLLSLPNVNPDAGFGMQMSIEDTLETNTSCFQAALLYTSSKGERRIRVHTMCLPVSNQLADVIHGADQKAIIGLLGKMAVDRCIGSSMQDARDAMLNAAIDMLSAYGSTLSAAQKLGQLPCAYQLRFMPALILALLKYRGFRVGSSTKLDDRVFALEQVKTLPLNFLLLELYPNLYPVHSLDDQNAINKNDVVVPQPALLHLSAANIDRHGAYLLDCGSRLLLWVGAAISDAWCQHVFDVPNFSAVQDGLCELPELENEASDRLRTFIEYRQNLRPFPASFLVLREDSRSRAVFLQYLVEDRTESTMSYYEFLQHLQKEVK